MSFGLTLLFDIFRSSDYNYREAFDKLMQYLEPSTKSSCINQSCCFDNLGLDAILLEYTIGVKLELNYCLVGVFQVIEF